MIEDFIRPCFRGQHGYGRENIQDVDHKRLEDENIEPEVSVGEEEVNLSLCHIIQGYALHAHAKAIVSKLPRIDEVEL